MANIDSAVRANNNFAFALYKELCKNGGDQNLFFSPLSITAALAMSHLGAGGNTAQEIKTALNAKDLKDDDLHSAFAALGEKLNTKEQSACVLKMANRVFAKQKNFNVKQDFLAATKKHYRAEAQLLDFAQDTENSRISINKWMEDQTNQKIKDLLPPGVINELTAMVLVNAIYFKGRWLNEFDPQATSKRQFALLSKERVNVDMMFKNSRFKFSTSEEFGGTLYLELPYLGNELSMGIVLSQIYSGFVDIREKLDFGSLEKLMSAASEDSLMVSIPKFKIESQARLKDMLTTLGIKDAFIEGTANFLNMADEPNLHLTEVVHKAFVEVNEEGTEAAAATGGVFGITSLPMEFNADHPFIFFIKDNATGAILFMGQLMNPNN